ncbi:MAG: hypothetical protein ACYDGN_09335 [Acidimicrobiales bacterium]
MFIQDFQVIDQPYGDVVERLRAHAARVLTDAIGTAQQEGDRLRTRVGPSSWPAPLAKTVEIRPGTLRDHADGVIQPFVWDSPRATSLFPRLDADLEVAPFGTEQTRVTLRGRYEPPGGLIGRGADQLIFHRIAEATLRSFLLQLCAGLQRSDGELSGSGGP